jgi:putative nucleotidyltransferase with HDIG domain
MASKNKKSTSIKKLQRCCEEWRDIFDAIRDPVFSHDDKFRIIRANQAYAELAGMPIKKIIGMLYWKVFPIRVGPLPECQEVQDSDFVIHDNPPNIIANNRIFRSRTFDVQRKGEDNRHFVHILEEITEKGIVEQEKRKVDRAFQAISNAISRIIYADKETALFKDICRILVDIGEYQLAWIGVLEDDTKRIRIAAKYGRTGSYLKGKSFHISDADSGNPCGKSIKTAQPVLAQHLVNNQETHWARCAVNEGFDSLMSLPMTDSQGNVFAVINLLSSYSDQFGKEEQSLLNNLTKALSYGIMTLRVRKDWLRLHEESLSYLENTQRMFDQTIKTVARMVEVRDPYTADHEERVAQLAVAIGQEMGESQEHLKWIHTGGLLHDIGKIQIPAEILSKPGKISSNEFNLIKEHPSIGYNLVEGIEFSSSITDIIAQHHERLDGSGYPHGLKGDQINPLAQILTVADVVEAISTHRPYRASLGIDFALDQIKKNRGVWYAPKAVDSCVKIFKKGRFEFKSI